MNRLTCHGAAAVALLTAIWAVPAAGAPPVDEVGAICRLRPRVLDVRRHAGALIARIELFGPGGSALDPTIIEPGVHVSSVRGVELPGPDEAREGIDENPTARRFEDAVDVRGGGHIPNGAREAVIRFDLPCDGDPATRDDGDAGDVLAMLLDVPDGQAVEVCLAGRVGAKPFRCCDSLSIRNRGLRDLPTASSSGDRSREP